jgi:outer membrane lipoprotein SlyB
MIRTNSFSSIRRVAFAAAVAMLAGCSSTGGLGSILGSVLGNGGGATQGNQLYGSVQGVDTRSQRIAIQQSNGQSVWIRYDNNTQVVYQNQNYSPTALESGDQVTANIQDDGNGSYYTSYVLVNQSVRGSNGGQPGNMQAFQGTVRQVDRQNGAFAMDESNFGRITVVLANGVSRAGVDRFNTLRAGDFVRFYGYAAGNSAVQLRQFY